MKSIKCFILGCSMLVMSASNVSAFTVVDPTNLLPNVQTFIGQVNEYLETASRWEMQIQEYVKQYEKLSQQYNALTGSKDSMTRLTNAFGMLKEIKSALALFNNTISSITNPNATLSEDAKKTQSELQAYNACEAYGGNKTNGKEEEINKVKKACTLLANIDYLDMTGTQELMSAITQAENALKEIQKELNNLNQGGSDENSLKTAQDLQNLISLVQSELQVRKDQLESFRGSLISLKSAAKQTMDQFRILASKTSAGLPSYGSNSDKDDDEE
jgi:hypothetical protein